MFFTHSYLKKLFCNLLDVIVIEENFKFDQYPQINEADDPMSSPRMRDEEWSQYENQSKVESSATQLR